MNEHYKKRFERLKQRFENFQKAQYLLSSAMAESQSRAFSDLEKEGLIQRFEFTFELAWKVIKDYLIVESVDIEHLTPRTVLKVAIQVNVIQHGDQWMAALEDRNLMSHTYDYAKFEQVIENTRQYYLRCFDELSTQIDKTLSGYENKQ